MARESTFEFLVLSVIVISVCLPLTICLNDDYFSYSLHRARRKDDHVQPELRLKRYVETAIPRLADSYSKKYQKNENGFSRMEMLGNLAVRTEGLMDPTIPGASAPEYVSTHVSNATQTSPVGSVSKKTSGPLNQSTVNATNVKTVSSPARNDSSEHYKNSPPEKDKQHVQLDLNEEFPPDITNNTLTKNNITAKKEDSHTYYNSTFIVDEATAKKFWVDLDSHPNTTVNEMLSGSHRRAATVKLSFDFPFYGQMIRNITIATGGFLYTGDYIHSWLAATQYIAPLMANFDTGMSDESRVKYRDNGTAFTVEWEKVMLQDKKEAGSFTFQTTLHKSGDIVFVYKRIPIPVEKIEDTSHPVKVGLSDAYIIDRTVFFVRRKTIYEYHRVTFEKGVQNWTVIYLKALPTCLSLRDCQSCLKPNNTFECKWCGPANRCSTGYDRHRQDWQWKQCDDLAIGVGGSCDAIPGPSSSPSKGSVTPLHGHDEHINESTSNERGSAIPRVATVVAPDSVERASSNSSYGHAGMMAFILFILTAAGAGLWVLYAYRNPHTQSGQILIKYRPSQWALRRGEARYTAATIHM